MRFLKIHVSWRESLIALVIVLWQGKQRVNQFFALQELPLVQELNSGISVLVFMVGETLQEDLVIGLLSNPRLVTEASLVVKCLIMAT